MRLIRQAVFFAFSLVLLWTVAARAEDDQGRSAQSPYFFVQSGDPRVDRFPLQSTTVRSSISGVIADVVVTQLYKNEGETALEATYVFPASTRAAVYGMKMTIGDRVITASIREREEAKHLYEQAKQEGRSASLLEQHRPNVFQMSVANILPGDEVKVELRYTELLVPEEGIYEFVYPTVVGPRYADGAAGKNPQDDWIANPYFHQGQPPKDTFHMSVDLSTGVPVQGVTCTSHKVQVAYESDKLVSIHLDPSEQNGGNRDFILRYRLSGGRMETGMILFEGEDENFFLLMAQPPQRVRTEEIPPREYIFIVDVSGSMRGFPLDISKRLLKDLIRHLRPTDRFNVLLFAGGSSLLSERSLPATAANIQRAVAVIERQRGGGGTELLPALKQALSMPHGEGTSRSVVVVTDGYVRVETEAFDMIRSHLGTANMFAFGIGSSVNRHIIEGMARVGMGEPFVITRPEEAPAGAEKFRKLIASPVLTDIRIDYKGFRAYDVEPPNLPDVMAERPLIVFGKWRGEPGGHILLKGMGGEGRYSKRIDVARFKPSSRHAALRYLWARHRISLLSDYNHLNPGDERKAEVTRLGLAYNLLTAFTSFVAVDEQIRNMDGRLVTVKQPLPLPQGVSDHAVGGAAPAAAQGIALRKQEVCKEAGDTSSASEGEKRTIRISSVSVQGGLDPERIRKIVESRLSEINDCLHSGPFQVKARPTHVIVLLTVDAQGRITQVSPQTGPTEKVLETCLRKSLKTVRLPKTTDGNGAQIRVRLQIQ